jgi:hypothetical protein
MRLVARDGGLHEQLAQPLGRAGGVEHGGCAVQLREGLGVVGVVAAEGGGDALGGEGYLEAAQEPAWVLDLGGVEQLRIWEGEQTEQALAGE